MSEPTSITKRYEFVEGDEKIVAPGIVVKRIRALVAIPALLWAPAVQPGDLGGYIAAANNLHAQVSGNAWVYGDALVYGNAQVYGDPLVYGNAWVSGNAWVYGNARVSGNAQVYGNGLICWFSNVGSENGTLTIYNTKDNTIEVTRGCFRGTVEQFLVASTQKHDERIKHEYKLLIEVGVSRITASQGVVE